MKTYRLYTGKDGQSHIERIDLARTPSWTRGLATTQIAFRESPVGQFLDWHPAPRRQFVIILSGQLEIGLGDVKGRVFRIGHLGSLNEMDLLGGLAGVEMMLVEFGVPLRLGSGLGAAQEFLLG